MNCQRCRGAVTVARTRIGQSRRKVRERNKCLWQHRKSLYLNNCAGYSDFLFYKLSKTGFYNCILLSRFSQAKPVFFCTLSSRNASRTLSVRRCHNPCLGFAEGERGEVEYRKIRKNIGSYVPERSDWWIWPYNIIHLIPIFSSVLRISMKFGANMPPHTQNDWADQPFSGFLWDRHIKTKPIGT